MLEKVNANIDAGTKVELMKDIKQRMTTTGVYGIRFPKNEATDKRLFPHLLDEPSEYAKALANAYEKMIPTLPEEMKEDYETEVFMLRANHAIVRGAKKKETQHVITPQYKGPIKPGSGGQPRGTLPLSSAVRGEVDRLYTEFGKVQRRTPGYRVPMYKEGQLPPKAKAAPKKRKKHITRNTGKIAIAKMDKAVAAYRKSNPDVAKWSREQVVDEINIERHEGTLEEIIQAIRAAPQGKKSKHTHKVKQQLKQILLLEPDYDWEAWARKDKVLKSMTKAKIMAVKTSQERRAS